VIVITESGERKWLSAVGGLFVKGRRKIERPFWWYKNTKDSEPVYLT
jgi:hypothetical protein